MFEKTLTDVVKGIRASKRDTALYISQCIAEIKTEINSSDMYVKANALQKLTFLQMMGYSMNWASFASIEVMSSPRFAHKRIGYLAASQGFTQDTEVVLLTTNLLKKELRGAVGGGMHGVYEAGLAINCISNIVTEDLASDLLPELTILTSHHQPYLRKKAILCLFKVFVKYPQGLRLTFNKLQQCLSDSNASVVSCAVNVITELSDKNPKNYLHLAPAFFDLLTQSSNNWMLIKVVKLLGSLVPEEPRLARKLLEPLATIVRNTQAKSLLYEAVHTITLCLPYCRKNDGSMPANVPDIVVLCAQVLRSFVEESDQNLKYLGLVGFGSLMQSHPRVLSAPDYRPLILACLSDQDVTIRTRALDLLKGMASQKNLIELVSQLLKHVEDATGNYKLDLVAKIVDMCSGDKYGLLRDFAWYLDILFQLGHMRGIEKHAELLRSQVTDVALRVLPVRAYAVRQSIKVILEGDNSRASVADETDGDDYYGDNGRGKHLIPEILPGAAWIIGEYSELIREALSIQDDDDDDDNDDIFVFDDSSTGTYHSIIQALTAPNQVQKLSTSTQKVYIQSAMKVSAAATSDTLCTTEEREACFATLQVNLFLFMQSMDPEVVERASTAFEFMSSVVGVSGGDRLHLHARREIDNHSDLLGLHERSNGAPSPAAPTSLVQQLQEASETFNYVLKPSPMKPVGAKAQRKKRFAPNDSTVDLNSTADLSLLGDLLVEEEEFRSRSKSQLECVSFTEQRLRRVAESTVTSVAPSTLDIFSLNDTHNAAHSFQKSDGIPAPFSSTQKRQGDPFYLDSSPSHVNEQQEDRGDSRFGTIQLLDSDEEPASADKKHKKTKKVKKTKHDRSKSDSINLLSFGEASGRPVATVYESDEDEDDDDNDHRANGPTTRGGRRKGPNKEFEGLAKVDLTTPLRDDEVMPERRHRVVPEKTDGKQRVDAKAKKKPKKQKKKSSSVETVGDLLGLGGYDPVLSVSNMNTGFAASTTSSNPINSAFDDLLGLDAPLSTPQLSTSLLSNPAPSNSELDAFASQPSSSKRTSERHHGYCWLKATLKHAGATGPPSCDWSQTALLYRIHRSHHEGGAAASVIFKFENRSTFQLNDVTVDLNNEWKSVLGTVAAGSSAESPEKVGPVPYTKMDCSQDCKGLLISSGCQVPFKLTLPAALFLSPESNLSLDTVAQELSSGEWSSHSAKIEISSGLSVEQAKSIVRSFLRADEVENVSASTTVATFTASSACSGARVRALAKFKESGLKVDIRCTSPNLGKALASDIKRLRL